MRAPLKPRVIKSKAGYSETPLIQFKLTKARKSDLLEHTCSHDNLGLKRGIHRGKKYNSVKLYSYLQGQQNIFLFFLLRVRSCLDRFSFNRLHNTNKSYYVHVARTRQ